ncbi:FAD/NAD(P)-binding domain-containing protein [Mycena alexandri]|uniref:FAD/NAD(P)-binding domain-containing protein n=1 Tax=Mycena alexandri TaxID=1745969 RepID=A0AAD6WML9_9AGAR|nr:FAD/NAD(P)-binding domain-containing protein [Mycena alexandri]
MQEAVPPLNVIIVGAGLVGFWRRCCTTPARVIASSFKTELGAGLAIPTEYFTMFGWTGMQSPEPRSPLKISAVTSMAYDGSAGMTSDKTDLRESYGMPWLMVHRVDLHNELRRLALEVQGDSPPVSLYLNHRVVSCDTDACTVTLEGGAVRTADLIIGADGIRVRLMLASSFTFGTAGFRWLTDAKALEPYPELDWIVRTAPLGARLISAPVPPNPSDGPQKIDHRTIVIYACRGGTMVNVLAVHEDRRNQDSVPWNAPVTQTELLDFFHDYHPRFKRFLALADDIHIWQMRVVPPLRTWVNKRVCLLGDAAHASLPTLGQGFGMGLEDAVALGALLPKSTHINAIEARLLAYESLRKERAEFVARESFEQQHVPAKRGLYLRSSEMRDRVMAYDVKEAAGRVLSDLENSRG